MRYLKTYKIFESSITENEYFKDIFLDLEDDGYQVHMKDKILKEISFDNANKVSVSEIEYDKLVYINSSNISIYKMVGVEYTLFSIDDIRDTLLRAESFVSDELESEVSMVYTSTTNNDNYYYKGINDIPKGTVVDSVSIYFRICEIENMTTRRI